MPDESIWQIALAFADIVTVATEREVPYDGTALLVARKGPHSIFAALSQCFPHITRDSKEKRPKNRHGVSFVELNKALRIEGLLPVRRRGTIHGGIQWSIKVFHLIFTVMSSHLYHHSHNDCCSSGQIGAGSIHQSPTMST